MGLRVVQFGLLSLLVIFKNKLDSRSASLHAHPILIFKITRNDNRPNRTPLSPITINYKLQ